MKTTKGNTYYYGEERKEVVCTEVGEVLSYFEDKEGSNYQFYNEDVYENNKS
jgi:hypothetical protein